MSLTRVFIITGTSSGIGRALVELLSKDKQNYIIGIARNPSIQASNYHHIIADLSNLSESKEIEMPEIDSIETISLINNAGMIGQIAPLEKLNLNGIEDTINLNYTTAMILATKFIQKYQSLEIKNKTILNVSSGAASSPYASWSNYCSSKAALEMLTKCINKEQEIMDFPIAAFAISPGVVDTNMQVNIRKTAIENFAMKPKFIELYEYDQLYPPAKVAEKIIDVAFHVAKYKEHIFRIELP